MVFQSGCPIYLLPTPDASLSCFFLRLISPKRNNSAFDYRTQEGIWPLLHQSVIPTCLGLLYKPINLWSFHGAGNYLPIDHVHGIILYFTVDKTLSLMCLEFPMPYQSMDTNEVVLIGKNTFQRCYPHLQTTGAPRPLNSPIISEISQAVPHEPSRGAPPRKPSP